MNLLNALLGVPRNAVCTEERTFVFLTSVSAGRSPSADLTTDATTSQLRRMDTDPTLFIRSDTCIVSLSKGTCRSAKHRIDEQGCEQNYRPVLEPGHRRVRAHVSQLAKSSITASRELRLSFRRSVLYLDAGHGILQRESLLTASSTATCFGKCFCPSAYINLSEPTFSLTSFSISSSYKTNLPHTHPARYISCLPETQSVIPRSHKTPTSAIMLPWKTSIIVALITAASAVQDYGVRASSHHTRRSVLTKFTEMHDCEIPRGTKGHLPVRMVRV